MLHNEILAATASGQPVTVAGLSMGSMVIDRELAYLAIDPNAPPSSALTFVELAGPERGLAQTYLPVGTTIPIAGTPWGMRPRASTTPAWFIASTISGPIRPTVRGTCWPAPTH